MFGSQIQRAPPPAGTTTQTITKSFIVLVPGFGPGLWLLGFRTRRWWDRDKDQSSGDLLFGSSVIYKNPTGVIRFHPGFLC